MTSAYSKIGIIGAMVEEIELLHKHVETTGTFVKAGITYVQGTLHGREVVFCKSGVGKVNAAVCTQLLIDAGVDCVLFTGVAGAVDPSLNIGDIVVSTTCLQHDMDCTPLGFAQGQIPFQEVSEFIADPQLVEVATNACERLFPGRSKKGKVLSGDQFIASREAVHKLYEDLGGACTEMEGAALAQVCVMNGIPFVVIRAMSDNADGSAHVNFAEFTVEAAIHSHQIIEDMIQQL
ncbi:5'-methylthioadenosine/S-adenosylhomocysteine nucleosidase [Paenibacillus baekrokdamisoli]|uniref:adenosylhomocysteine nucleosidase n=1 Tax=Paenibacillus baekrokdamisoli TaxID=1712516 RepID=A0A3G9IL38_9BACL|nr:5'-methylthioadenosine/adenosylhomocysteine nucleosidase [Paenibacillus baekrokdamisoli]MBB3067198.1 adenosylhomocysteine nucleosidase [Paenibacillus baekrokdamisoli]BBH19610.1 5'-methylthioadenosine/S-adenosylhomocysteine nucleosidase [Paenibacillus baekrokdamisoli]